MALPTAYTTEATNAVYDLLHVLRDERCPERIQALRHLIATAEEALADEVRAARDAGDSWGLIGAALGTTRQSAHERYGS